MPRRASPKSEASLSLSQCGGTGGSMQDRWNQDSTCSMWHTALLRHIRLSWAGFPESSCVSLCLPVSSHEKVRIPGEHRERRLRQPQEPQPSRNETRMMYIIGLAAEASLASLLALMPVWLGTRSLGCERDEAHCASSSAPYSRLRRG